MSCAIDGNSKEHRYVRPMNLAIDDATCLSVASLMTMRRLAISDFALEDCGRVDALFRGCAMLLSTINLQ